MSLKNKIVFSSGKSGDYDIWSLDLNKKNIAQLTQGNYWNDCPKWSPAGDKIIFISNRSGTAEIWVMDEDGSNQTRITKTEKIHNTPDWSSDGKKIVFTANYDGNINIYIMNIDGVGLKQITDYPENDSAPQFSPDDSKIIFASARFENDNIWSYDLKSKKYIQLTKHKEKDFSPTFSPHANLIAFVSGETGEYGEGIPDIYLMDADGNNIRKITSLGSDRYVSWAPEGNALIYTNNRSEITAERMLIFDLDQVKPIGIFSLLPKKIYQEIYPENYLGSERYPDWK